MATLAAEKKGKNKKHHCLQWQTAVLSPLNPLWTEHKRRDVLKYWWGFCYLSLNPTENKNTSSWSKTHFQVLGMKCFDGFTAELTSDKYLWCVCDLHHHKWSFVLFSGVPESLERAQKVPLLPLQAGHFLFSLWGAVSLCESSEGLFFFFGRLSFVSLLWIFSMLVRSCCLDVSFLTSGALMSVKG